jgi:ADP-ribose pyrophosphatase YjhB (NUDIX family)
MKSEIEQEFAWLGANELESARSRLPILHINVVPVRVNALGDVTHVGLLLRGREDGQISRSIISGRVMYGERVREALIRHIEKDLGPVAFPRIPQSLIPFDVVEYFPDASVTGYHDPRQHAVALAYVIAVTGECQPSQESLDLVWFDLSEASSEVIRSEMSDGHDRVVRGALSHVGRLL